MPGPLSIDGLRYGAAAGIAYRHEVFAPPPLSPKIMPEYLALSLNENGPPFFLRNLASLSRVLSFVTELGVTEHQEGQVTRHEIVYRPGP